MAEIGLDGASVVAVVGELEPAGMPQHVGMHEEREFRRHARPGNHALISGYGQRGVTFRDERYSRLRLPTVTFTEVGAALRGHEFSMETALPPVRTVTD
jgi:hypothetical protein